VWTDPELHTLNAVLGSTNVLRCYNLRSIAYAMRMLPSAIIGSMTSLQHKTQHDMT
jgi:hypothetical protein